MTMRASFGFTALTVAALGLAACSPPNENPSPQSTGEAATTAEAQTTAADTTEDAGAAIAFEDGVVRAKGTDNEMTAIFGTLINTTEDEIAVSGFTTNLDAGAFEMHEVVDGVMQEKPDGFTIAPGGEHELAPGGDHLMIMGHPEEIPAGDTVALTVLLDDGSEIDLGEVPVRTIGAGEENYGADGELHGGHGGEG